MAVSRPIEILRGAHAASRERLIAISHQSERTLLLGGILLLSAVSGATAFVLAQYLSIDVLSSLVFLPHDCWHLGIQADGHCFSDYERAISYGMQPNPWNPPLVNPYDQNVYTAAGTVPPLLFGLLSGWLQAPRLGLPTYLLVLTIAVLSPAVWAARGARDLERVVVVVALGAAAIPAWAVVDRANSVGFLVPICLGFLLALCRQRWGLVAIMVVLAALVRPQFAVLVVVLFAARQWRFGAIAVAGTLMSNLAAYLLWPQDFPDTIRQSIHNTLHFGSAVPALDKLANVSFANGLLLPDKSAARSLIGYVVLVVVIVCLLALGRRITPVMAGITLLAAASLSPAMSYKYYLVFALPIAAVVARAPDNPPRSGLFDGLRTRGDRRRAAGVCVTLASVISIAHIALPGTGQPPAQDSVLVWTTSALAPGLWLLASAVIIVSYARRPAPLEEREVLAEPALDERVQEAGVDAAR
jgi:hypothetical protein